MALLNPSLRGIFFKTSSPSGGGGVFDPNIAAKGWTVGWDAGQADGTNSIDLNNGFCLIYTRNSGIAHANETIAGGTSNTTTWHHLVAASFGP